MIRYYKKILLVLFFCFCFFLSSCETKTTAILPDLTGYSREQIANVLSRKKIKYTFMFVPLTYQSEQEYDQFIRYGNELKSGDEISLVDSIVIYTTALPLTFSNVSQAILDKEYEGKSFIEDGIGKVTLYRNIDGDTAHFKDENNEIIKVRFLGVDTPEATTSVDPWGYAASAYTASILNNANSIVLEADGNRLDTYGRYLAYVWADGVLVNLALVNQAYSTSSLSASSRFFPLFIDAEIAASKTGRRIYGEIDPAYRYN